ncbi:glycosyltransferase family 2 protein [Lysobacter soyae]|uniref:Glycosyltransferase family 2 protein n=1 Tax=Lysobacter soyae TaxID=2764185 RepID=A0ABX8WPD7_9GAMM|nr:glycosyltransferase family 2 protein [Lysobacter sp. CJ11]QYR52721.1 glycosyltransferase family 2 protein [Lysobacter sp. CJ11]
MQTSVVVCTHNGEAFLREQLDSILRQTRPPSEIIISDDGSTDSSVSIIEAFATKAQAAGIACQVVANVRALGVTGNFESACQRANGEVIFLADQDDVWHTDKVDRLLKVLAQNEVVLVSSNAEIIDAAGQKTNETLFSRLRISPAELSLLRNGDLSNLILYRTAFTGATFAFKKSLLKHALPFDRKLVHDEWLVQVAWVVGEVRTVQESLMDYRLHASNTIGLDAPAVESIDDTFGARLGSHLQRIIGKLTPLVERFENSADGVTNAKRLLLRRKQLELALARGRYPKSLPRRLHAVFNNWKSKLYAVEPSPMRTAMLDIFRNPQAKSVS